MTPKNLLRAASALLCLVASASFSQDLTINDKNEVASPSSASSSQQLIIKKIEVEGSTPYSPASIQAVSLLWIGESISRPAIQIATQHLLETGAFASVQTTLAGPPGDTTIVFNVKPVASSHLLAVGLENFVWFKPEELEKDLAKLVPLYNGTIPDSQNQLNAVAVALQQILANRDINATVTRVPVQTASGAANWVAEYRAEAPAVLIHSIKVEGVPAAFTTAVNATVQSLIGTPYNEGRSPLGLEYTLLAPFQNAGYQASSAKVISRTIASSNSQSVEVDVIANVAPGPIYHVSSIAWANSPELSETQFLAICPVRVGGVASRSDIYRTLQNITSAYHNKGFLEVAVHYSQSLDNAKREDAISITAFAGPQYTVRTVTPVNLTPAQQTAFENTWQLYPGSIYNQSYVTNYLKSHPDIAGYETSLDAIPGTDRNAVDLTLNFVKGGTFNP